MRILVATIAALVLTSSAQARPPVPPDVYKAVRAYWHTYSERVEAFNIVSCETGGRYNTTARNGQYLGLFQMGSGERAKFGHGSSALEQAKAARRYFDYERSIGKWGWSPWTCA